MHAAVNVGTSAHLCRKTPATASAEVVNQWLDDFAAMGTIGTAWGLLWEPELAGFREDARFATLAGRMRLPDYWQRHGPPDGYDWRDGRLIPR